MGVESSLFKPRAMRKVSQTLVFFFKKDTPFWGYLSTPPCNSKCDNYPGYPKPVRGVSFNRGYEISQTSRWVCLLSGAQALGWPHQTQLALMMQNGASSILGNSAPGPASLALLNAGYR